jgi:[ribosomal protein S5]-alanine N-acetyltransferase
MAESFKDYHYPTIECERVYLKVLTLEHLEEVFIHFKDGNVTKFMDIEPCHDLQEAVDIIQYHLDDQGCRWGIFHKITNEFMGTCGFHFLRQSDKLVIAETGFDLSKTFWGKGYMQEVISVIIEYGLNEMGLGLIDATVEQQNIRSINLMKRLGFKMEPELRDNLLYFTLYKKN